MTTIPGYNVREEDCLGYITWYTLYQPDVTHDRIEQLVNDHNLDKHLLPPKPRVVDAFKRACRYTEKTKIRLPGTDNIAKVMVPRVAQTPDEVERQMVVQIADPEGRTLSYDIVAKLLFNREHNTLTIDPIENYDLQWLVDERVNKFQQEFKYALEHIDHQVLRRIIREEFDFMNALIVRSGGGVYFIPKDRYDRLLGLQMLFSVFDNGSVLHSLPLLDSTDQRNMVKSAFETAVHDQAIKAITDLKESLKGGGSVPFKVWEDYNKLSQVLADRKAEYEDLVGEEIDKASIELKSIKSMLTEAAAEGRIE